MLLGHGFGKNVSIKLIPRVCQNVSLMQPRNPLHFPVRWPREYRALALSLGPGNPLLRMGSRDPTEALADPEALGDPTGEVPFQPVPFVVRKHRNRAVVLAASRCFFYCRFCFRRGSAFARAHRPGRQDWEEILLWLRRNPEVTEVILTGGDPLTLSNARLKEIAERLAMVPSLQRWRIHTRAPVTFPKRVTEELLNSMASALPLRIALHVNHPAEVRPAFRGAVQRFREAGIPVLNQTVLLAGVNDDVRVLSDLFRRLAQEGVAPHYLHHPDRAPGNGVFRLSVERGLRLYRGLEEFIGPSERGAIPPYVLDLPNGAGKCRVQSLRPVARERAPQGRRLRYRWVRPPGWDSLAREEACEFWDVWERGRLR